MSDDRRPGRPPLDPNHRSIPVTVRLSPSQYDDAHQQARRERITLPELIRRRLSDDDEADD